MNIKSILLTISSLILFQPIVNSSIILQDSGSASKGVANNFNSNNSNLFLEKQDINFVSYAIFDKDSELDKSEESPKNITNTEKNN